ncbi:methylglyoxal synthase [Pontibacter sp. G13]|uniref:methylglyoxal synthase n=1 Tax=Pontibacter sp. G13 TaxID=3074898 RepID=UPI00288BDC02|nr:methylglyoxal synthase [Pontibacter sp. G13]WNJ18903.1 methylglyoxal synthase [Pontibacter sp. G13]
MKKTIALVAHDSLKQTLAEWVKQHVTLLADHDLVCTGTTGTLIESVLKANLPTDSFEKLNIHKLKSGPLGGDQQLGARIAEGQVDLLIFLWDPMSAQPHDVDVKALLRISAIYNVPTANNEATADYLIQSPLFKSGYQPKEFDYSQYLGRKVHQYRLDQE